MALVQGFWLNGRYFPLMAGGAPTTEELLKIVEALDETKRTAEEQPPSDEDLTGARVGLVEALKAAAEGDKPDLEAARAIRSAIDRIDAEAVTRTEAVEAAKVEAAKLLEGVEPVAQTDPVPDPATDPDAGDPPADPATDPATADTKDAKVPVAASLADAINRSSKRKAEKVREPEPSDVLIASVGPAQGWGLDNDATPEDVAKLFGQYAPQVKRGGAVLVHMDKIYPEERALGLSAEENTRLINAVTTPVLTALTAAGGICDPLPADFSHPICGDRGRPITNALPSFRADRGGVRYAPSATVADLESAITVWTNETDEDPASDTKACPRVECEEELSAKVDAIVACLTVGNFQARFNTEFWRSRLDLLMVAHDRVAEQTAYAKMIAAATTTLAPADAGEGTVIDTLRVIDMQVSGIRSRHRLIGTQFRTVLPSWWRDAARTHLAKQVPGGQTDLLNVGDAILASFFATRGVTPIWSPDIELIGAQGSGAVLVDYNSPFSVLTFPEGTYLFLDGGTLDLGTQISDSTLNATNDRQAFMETFEDVVFRGCEALVTPVTVTEDCFCAA